MRGPARQELRRRPRRGRRAQEDESDEGRRDEAHGEQGHGAADHDCQGGVSRDGTCAKGLGRASFTQGAEPDGVLVGAEDQPAAEVAAYDGQEDGGQLRARDDPDLGQARVVHQDPLRVLVC